MGSERSRKAIVITGFGPFGTHSVNASSDVVSALRAYPFPESTTPVFVENIPVAYDCVSEQAPQLWEKHQPELMVHIGVAGNIDGILLEQRAVNMTSRTCPDVNGTCPVIPEIDCKTDAKFCETTLDLATVTDQLNQDESINVLTAVSKDAGQFLCNYVYYLSLSRDASRTVFIHIPPLNEPYSVDELAKAVHAVILKLWDQVGTSMTESDSNLNPNQVGQCSVILS